MAINPGNAHRNINFFIVSPSAFVIAVAMRSGIQQQACHLGHAKDYGDLEEL
jgi:hypothetical protein